MGAKQSTNNSHSSGRSDQAGPSSASQMGSSSNGSGGLGLLGLRSQRDGGASSSNSDSARQRARSLSHVLNGHSGQSVNISPNHDVFDQESDANIPVDVPIGRVYTAHSLPVQLVSFHGIKCPVCSKFVPPDDVECHLVMCLTKPRIVYNEDVLLEDKGECVICLDDLTQGDTIARLPCLCIYHKMCIDAWFKVNRSCPEHPSD